MESAQCLSRETNLDLNKYEVCDNVCLETVLMDYISYYRVKFSKDPKITKKLGNPPGKLYTTFYLSLVAVFNFVIFLFD